MTGATSSTTAGAAPASATTRLLKAGLRVVLAFAMLAGVLWWVDPRQVAGLVARADPWWLAAGLASAVVASVASALRWRALGLWLGGSVPAGWSIDMYFRGITMNALLPGAVVGGDMYRAHGLVRRGMPWMEAGLSVIFDRLSGLWVLFALGSAAAAWGVTQPAGAQALAALGVDGLSPLGFVLIAVLLLVAPLGVLIAWRLGVAVPEAGIAERADRDPAEGAKVTWHRRLVLIAHRPAALEQYGWQLLGSTVVQLLSIGVLACGGAALGLGLPFWAYAVAAVPTFLMATLPVSFGGWGTREAAAVLAFGAFGIAAPQAVAVSMLFGLSALTQALGGAVLMLRARRGAVAQPA